MNNIPHTLHCYEADRYIIENNNARLLFQIIFNNYLRKIYNNLDARQIELTLSTEYLSKISGLHEQTVKSLRKSLCDLGLITASRGKINVQLKYYLSLVRLITDIFDDEEMRSRFTIAVAEKDDSALEDLGFYQLTPDEMKEMLGVLLFHKYKNCTKVQNDYQEEYKNCTKVQNDYPESSEIVLKYKNCTKVQNDYQEEYKNCTKVQKDYQLGTNFVLTPLNTAEFIHKTLLEIGGLVQKSSLSSFLRSLSVPPESFELEDWYKNATEDENLVNFGLIGLQAMLTDYLRKVQNHYRLGTNFVLNDPSSVVVFTPRTYIEKKIKQKIRESEALLIGGEKQKAGEVEENESFITFGKVEVPELIDQEPPVFKKREQELPDDSEEEIEDSDKEVEEDSRVGKDSTFRRGSDIFQKSKLNIAYSPYKSKPYYNSQEVEEILELESAVKSPVKYVLNNFLYELLGVWEKETDEDYSQDSDYSEEEGQEPPEPTIDDMLRYRPTFTMEEAGECWRRALEISQEDLGIGSVDDGRERHRLEFDEIPEIDPLHVIEWEAWENCVRLRADRIKNIEAGDVEIERAPRSKEETRASRRKSRAVMKAIMECGEEGLTPVEKAIRKFSEGFVRFDENYSVEGFKDWGCDDERLSYLPARLYKARLFCVCEECGVQKSVFYETLEQGTDFVPDSDIRLKPVLFPWERISNANARHGWSSEALRLAESANGQEET